MSALIVLSGFALARVIRRFAEFRSLDSMISKESAAFERKSLIQANIVDILMAAFGIGIVIYTHFYN